MSLTALATPQIESNSRSSTSALHGRKYSLQCLRDVTVPTAQLPPNVSKTSRPECGMISEFAE